MTSNEPVLMQQQGFSVVGIGVRTCNQDEFNPKTAKLGSLWSKFREENIPQRIAGCIPHSPVYGVYTDYETDANGYYNLIAGVASELAASSVAYTTVCIPEGQYLVFSAQGVMPDIVVQTWQHIWTYFSQEKPFKRSFVADFECYQDAHNVAIYIGVEAI